MNTLTKPNWSQPTDSARWRNGWCSPAVALNGTSACWHATMNRASESGSGCASAVVPPVRILAPDSISESAAIMPRGSCCQGISNHGNSVSGISSSAPSTEFAPRALISMASITALPAPGSP